MARFSLTEKQAKAILEMRLQRLTSLEVDKIINELKELAEQIKELKYILGSHDKQSEIIRTEFSNIKARYGDERRTEIIPISGDLSIEELKEEENTVSETEEDSTNNQ